MKAISKLLLSSFVLFVVPLMADSSESTAPFASTSHWIWRSDSSQGEEIESLRKMSSPAPYRKSEFRYMLLLAAIPERATLHVMSTSDFEVQVNEACMVQRKARRLFDYEEIRPCLHPGMNEVLIHSKAGHKGTFVAASIHLEALGVPTTIVSGKQWQVRVGMGPWTPVTLVERMSASDDPDRIVSRASLFRKQFRVEREVTSAELLIAGVGAYRLYFNNERLKQGSILNHDSAAFPKQLTYRTYDVSSLVRSGQNAIGIVLGPGWHGATRSMGSTPEFRGPEEVRAQLKIHFKDGSLKVVGTDSSWLTTSAAIQDSQPFSGEAYDRRAEIDGWRAVEFSPTGWKQAADDGERSALHLYPEAAGSDMIVKTIKPAKVLPIPSQRGTLIDVGYLMEGNLFFHLQGKRGAVIHVRYGAKLREDGSVDDSNAGAEPQEDIFTLAGTGDEAFSPAFTIHTFRYAEVTGAVASDTILSVDCLLFEGFSAKEPLAH